MPLMPDKDDMATSRFVTPARLARSESIWSCTIKLSSSQSSRTRVISGIARKISLTCPASRRRVRISSSWRKSRSDRPNRRTSSGVSTGLVWSWRTSRRAPVTVLESACCRRFTSGGVSSLSVTSMMSCA